MSEELRACDVCSIVNHDYTQKMCAFCSLCKAWMCRVCRVSPRRRMIAAALKKLGMVTT